MIPSRENDIHRHLGYAIDSICLLVQKVTQGQFQDRGWVEGARYHAIEARKEVWKAVAALMHEEQYSP